MEKKNAIFSKKESQLSSQELKELGQVALSVNQWEGRCQNWGCRMERPESHNGEAEGSNFLNLVVCASSEQDKTKTGVFKDSSKDGCHSWQGNGTEKRSTIL